MKRPVALEGRNRAAALGALAVLALWVYYGVALHPLWSAASRTRLELQQAAWMLRDIEQGLLQEPQLLQQQRELEARVAQMRGVVPMEDQLPNVLQHLSEVAAQTGIKVQSLTPQSDPSKEVPTDFRLVPIQLDALAGYHQLGVFLSRAELEGPPVQLQRLRVSSNAKLLRRHDVNLTLHASLALLNPADPSGADGTRKGARKAKAKGKGKKK